VGLRVRACGEDPSAAEAAGIDALRTRFWAVVIGGAIASLGGVYLSLAELDLYSDGMTAGRGFIALAAVIFGRWTPLGATGAALFFGFFAALQYSLQRAGVPERTDAGAALRGGAGRAGGLRRPRARARGGRRSVHSSREMLAECILTFSAFGRQYTGNAGARDLSLRRLFVLLSFRLHVAAAASFPGRWPRFKTN
jgi:hypothetical protein